MGQDAPSPYDFYYRTMKNPNIKNYKTYYNNIYKESPTDLDNNYNYYIPLNEGNLTEMSDNAVSPEKQNNFIFHKKEYMKIMTLKVIIILIIIIMIIIMIINLKIQN